MDTFAFFCFLLLFLHIKGSRPDQMNDTAIIIRRDAFRNMFVSSRFDPKLIETCVQETCGQLAGENFIRPP